MSKFKVGDKCKFNCKFDFERRFITPKKGDLTFTVSHVDYAGRAYTLDVLFIGDDPCDDEGWCLGDQGFDVVEE